MRKSFFFFLYFFSFFSLYGLQEYSEPQEVATTEGLPSSLVNQAVCAISGEYTDSIVDVVIPGSRTFGNQPHLHEFLNRKTLVF